MFENRLKLLRESRGLSMKQVSNDLGIPYTTYIHYEKNENEPNSEILVKLALYFNVSADYLLGMDQDKKTDLPLIADERKVLELKLETLSTESLEEIDKFMDFLLWKEEQ